MAPQLRRVASAARDLLVEQAAKEWNVAPENLQAANAKVTDPSTGRSLSYAELAKVLGIRKGTVMSRLFHARLKMQKKLREYLGEDEPEGEER